MLVTKKAPDFTATVVLSDGSIKDNFKLYDNFGKNGTVIFFLSFRLYFCMSK